MRKINCPEPIRVEAYYETHRGGSVVNLAVCITGHITSHLWSESSCNCHCLMAVPLTGKTSRPVALLTHGVLGHHPDTESDVETSHP